jgi:Sulfotransferase family
MPPRITSRYPRRSRRNDTVENGDALSRLSPIVVFLTDVCQPVYTQDLIMDSRFTLGWISGQSASVPRKQERDRRFKRVTNKEWRYAMSALGSLVEKRHFNRVQSFCLFIGYPRSGHTLIGSLLDAHPNAVIADEMDALKYIQAGFRRDQLFYLLLRGSRRAAKAGRQRTGYSYAVPGQWQGRFDKLRVIGDKAGGASAVRLAAFPSLLDTLSNGFNTRLKFIHVTRNPYDVISTMAEWARNPLENSCGRFFDFAESIDQIKKEPKKAEIYDLKHEDFIASPKAVLKELCRFLNLEENDAYFEACASIVYQSPHKSRLKAPWNPALIDAVKQKLNRVPFLKDYSFED